MTALRLGLRQVRYEAVAFVRNPAAAFFTFVFPLIFLVIFNLLFGNQELVLPGGTTNVSTFYVPAIAALSVINACYTGLAMSMSVSRDLGLLKRLRGTPLPAASFLLGRVLFMTVVALALVAIVTLFGALFYGVDIPTNTLPAFVISLAIGAAAFSLLGLAITTFIPNADAAPAVVNASILPLLFISDVFIRIEDDGPGWLGFVGDLFPVKHLSLALQTAFNPFETGSGFEPAHLGIIALWGLVGALIAARRFSWEPRV
ncbi:MAG: ABC transporter permease [Chloroflexi bacterium]|nr:ABC transporter permease [Chloroflexota bacterium]MDA1147494.1 ABC transporter permease [Chloroflexota bacterium]